MCYTIKEIKESQRQLLQAAYMQRALFCWAQILHPAAARPASARQHHHPGLCHHRKVTQKQ